MELNFSYIYDNIFSIVGELFGKLIALSVNDFDTVVDFISGNVGGTVSNLDYTNLFTGVTSSYLPPLDWLPDILQNFFAVPLQIIRIIGTSFGLSDMPFIFGILLFIVEVVICVRIVSFVVSSFIKIVF